jgi:hypothetical protein
MYTEFGPRILNIEVEWRRVGAGVGHVRGIEHESDDEHEHDQSNVRSAPYCPIGGLPTPNKSFSPNVFIAHEEVIFSSCNAWIRRWNVADSHG